MRIAILSDTHDNIWVLKNLLAGLQADTLLFCGDFCAPFTLAQIAEGFAGPVHVVFGNNDGDKLLMSQVAGRFPHVTLHGDLAELELDGHFRGTFRPDPDTYQIFLEGSTVTVDIPAGTASFEETGERPGLRQANFLHLNEAKKLWTWMADLYAVGLLVLAVTGLFVLRGRNGITGRGAWLTAVGVAIPAVFLLLYL